MRTVLLLCPQSRDFVAVRVAGLEERYVVRFAGPDLDGPDRVDVEALLRELEALPADGVVATKDRSALLGAILAERRGLPGPAPAAVAACQHKPTARALQASVVSEATPAFTVLGGDRPPFGPPWFVKPVVGRLSQGARLVTDASELATVCCKPGDRYAEEWQELAALAGFRQAARGFLAEEVLAGALVTLEGYAHAGVVTVIGVTDSVMYPGTASFERFEYPSRLAPDRLDELTGVARKLLPALGFDAGFFNVEFFVPERSPAQIVEVNGRIASQFAPLYTAVHGRSSYDALFALACGEDPDWRPGAPDGVAVSYVRRAFADAYVEAAPDVEDAVEVLAGPGRNLSDSYANDPGSFRLAIVYEAGETAEEAVARARARADALRFRLAPPRPP